MRIIIAGAGRLGLEMAEVVAQDGNDVTLIDNDENLVNQLRGTLKVQVKYGDACEPAALEEAGALKADVFIASTGDDEDNLVISFLAKRHFDVPRVVARVNNRRNEWLFSARWGVDHAVSAVSALMPLIQEATGSADTVGLVRLAAGGVGVIETTLTDQSRAVGQTLADLEIPKGAIVVAVVRADGVHVPDGRFGLEAGDEVLVVSEAVPPDQIRRVFQ